MWSSTTAAARGPIRRIPKVNRCLAEGRKAFLGTYASLEAGDECARWEPVLSALLDGEAKAKDAQALRGHLRSCAGCRASLRALHEGGADLRVLFPVPLVIGQQAAEHHDATANLVLRVYEAIAGGVHERASASLVRMQGFIEGASATKVAAVAASAAAVAGGGTVAVQEVREREEPTRIRPAPAEAAAPAAAVPVVSTAASSSVTRVPSATRRAAERDVAAERRAAERARARARAAARRAAAERRRARAAAAAATTSPDAAFSFAEPAPAAAPSSGGSSGSGTSASSPPADAAFGP